MQNAFKRKSQNVDIKRLSELFKSASAQSQAT